MAGLPTDKVDPPTGRAGEDEIRWDSGLIASGTVSCITSSAQKKGCLCVQDSFSILNDCKE